MGWGQSKPQSQDVIAQATVHNSVITQKLDSLSWVVIGLVAIIILVIGYMTCKRCRHSAKGWVRRQMTSSNPAMVTVQTVPCQQSVPPQYSN